MNKEINIFLDDYRQPSDCAKYMSNSEYYVNNEFIIVKDYPSFKDLIDYCKRNEVIIKSVSFDHDLCSNHYGLTSYDSLTDENNFTGYHACKYLLEKYNNQELCNTHFYIHTMSKFGLIMLRLLINNICFKKNIKSIIKEITPSIYLC